MNIPLFFFVFWTLPLCLTYWCFLASMELKSRNVTWLWLENPSIAIVVYTIVTILKMLLWSAKIIYYINLWSRLWVGWLHHSCFKREVYKSKGPFVIRKKEKWFNIVKLCVHFVSVSKKIKKWTQTDTIVTLNPPTTRQLFLVSNERYGKINTFLLWWYGIIFALIKDINTLMF